MAQRAILITPNNERFYLTDAQFKLFMTFASGFEPVREEQTVEVMPINVAPTPVEPTPVAAVLTPKSPKTIDLFLGRFPDGRYIVRLPDGRLLLVTVNGAQLPITSPNNTESHFGLTFRGFAFFNASGASASIDVQENADTYRGTFSLSGLTTDGVKITLTTDGTTDSKQIASVGSGIKQIDGPYQVNQKSANGSNA